MGTNYNFKSQICTTREQSERLLALGLKKETADMVYRSYGYIIDEYGDKERRFKQPTIRDAEDYEGKYDIPAWSLHRLIEMMPRSIKCRNGSDYADLYVNYDLVQYRFYDTDYMHDVCYEHFNDGDVYSNVIDCIEWLIKERYFNEEYLV